MASLTTIKKRNGYKQTLSYDARFNLPQVVDSYNRKLIMTYSSGGTAPFATLLSTLTTPDGLVLTYIFLNSKLNQVRYSTNPISSIAYFLRERGAPDGAHPQRQRDRAEHEPMDLRRQGPRADQ